MVTENGSDGVSSSGAKASRQPHDPARIGRRTSINEWVDGRSTLLAIEFELLISRPQLCDEPLGAASIRDVP